jgi:hypothetical protein
VDIKKRDTTIISTFKSKPELSLDKKERWTSYPPNFDTKKILPYETFLFSEHPYFLHFKSGELSLIETKDGRSLAGMSLSLAYETKEIFDSVYKSIKGLYGAYSSKAIKRPGMYFPSEETKYLSKNGKDYVIVSNGGSDNMQYIYIAYDWQGYEW